AVPDPAVLGTHGHTHPHQFGHRTRGEPVAADLVPREGRLLQQQDIQAGSSQVMSGPAARGARTYDDGVGTISSAHLYHPFLLDSASVRPSHRADRDVTITTPRAGYRPVRPRLPVDTRDAAHVARRGPHRSIQPRTPTR